LPETRGTREQAIDLQFTLRSAPLPSGDLGRILACLREAKALAATLDDPRQLAEVSVFPSPHYHGIGMASLFSGASWSLTMSMLSGSDGEPWTVRIAPPSTS
jgi:hypothetical protein